MRMTKLTLSAEKELIKEAKELAQKEGTSLSSMFSRFLRAILAGRRKNKPPGPLTRRATGLVKLPAGRSDRDLLQQALDEKYNRRT
jgi:hypothetical protein